MNNFLEYNGYTGSIEWSDEDGLYFGKVSGIRSLLSYEGSSLFELFADFKEAVDGYLELCKEEGITPEIPENKTNRSPQ